MLNKRNNIFNKEYELLEEAIRTTQNLDFKTNDEEKQFNRMVSGYEKLLRQSERLVSVSDKQQKHLYKLQSELKNILDSIDQGILTVNEMLIINKGCSAECERIFGQKIVCKNLISLLKPYNCEEKLILLQSIITKDFFQWDALKKSVTLMLLPDEFNVEERVYGIKYKPITLDLMEQVENVFMIVMTDITEKRAMQRKLENEKVIFKAVTRIFSDLKSFSACVRDFRSFYEEKLPGFLGDDTEITPDILNEIFREVHTLKGNFAAFEIPWIVNFLEGLEQSLLVVREHISCMNFEEISFILKGYDFKGVLDDLFIRLQNMIGSKWIFDNEIAIVDVDAIKALELEAGELSKSLAQKIKRLRYSKFSELLSTYPQYTFQLAHRLGKSISPFIIEYTEDIYVDAEKYYEFARSLVNVFRNCADHGIELPEERVAAYKPIEGEIRCVIERGQNGFKVIISDDGRGIDIEKIKRKACNIGVVEQCTAEEMMKLIFGDGVSTADSDSLVSGRGVGLAAVKHEVELLGGKVEVSSQPGKGTTFMFYIPCELQRLRKHEYVTFTRARLKKYLLFFT